MSKPFGGIMDITEGEKWLFAYDLLIYREAHKLTRLDKFRTGRNEQDFAQLIRIHVWTKLPNYDATRGATWKTYVYNLINWAVWDLYRTQRVAQKRCAKLEVARGFAYSDDVLYRATRTPPLWERTLEARGKNPEEILLEKETCKYWEETLPERYGSLMRMRL